MRRLTRCNSIARPSGRTKDIPNLHFKRRGYFSAKLRVYCNCSLGPAVCAEHRVTLENQREQCWLHSTIHTDAIPTIRIPLERIYA